METTNEALGGNEESKDITSETGRPSQQNRLHRIWSNSRAERQNEAASKKAEMLRVRQCSPEDGKEIE